MMTQTWEYSSANTHSQLQKYYPWFLAKPLKKKYERLTPPPFSALPLCCGISITPYMTAIYLYKIFYGGRGERIVS